MFQELNFFQGGATSLTPLPPSPPPQESAPLGHIFALPAMNGPLPAEWRFRENTR